ncbi:MAG: addiction module toxin, RelE/StbE family, partial [candidate division NC10 bacterium]|nr:addiction module toxin, RelE/StbE family [candidate division NC10 bacterium]
MVKKRTAPVPDLSLPEIAYKASVENDVAQLAPKDAARVITKLEVTLRGEGLKGEALSGKFKGLYKLRVGDYRVIYSKTERGYLVLKIGHRRDVYSGRG